MREWIVELEPGVWLAEVEGDPGRTLVEGSAQRFDCRTSAWNALKASRGHGCGFSRTRVLLLEQCLETPVDLVAHLYRQREFSKKTFGPPDRPHGILKHIRSELEEIEADPTDLKEWVDVVLLALDGAWRAGHSPQEIADAIVAKQTENESRSWPDWRTVEAGEPIEHERTEDR